MVSVDMRGLDVWCKVDNENFSDELAYKPLAYLDYGESATGQLLFLTDEGALYALPVTQTRIVRGHEMWSRELREEEANIPFFLPGEITSFRGGVT